MRRLTLRDTRYVASQAPRCVIVAPPSLEVRTMYAAYIVRRTQIYLDDKQDARLERRAGAARVTKSRLIREAIDLYLTGRQDETRELERFRAAVRAAAGSAPCLPSGTKYVTALRRKDAHRQRELDRRR